jgi:PqqD family protein of HPr-rel-A system
MEADRSPAPRLELVSYELDDDLMVFDPVTGQAHFLNPTAASIWQMLDGAQTVAGLARAIGDAYKIPYGTALADVRGTLAGLAEAGLLR